jgi:glyoxalase family protein
MPAPSPGLHHVTGIAGPPQRNLDFYGGALGLRLVKQTVNFDDPGTYHFYFGDAAGSPGSIITFFPWPRAARGASGGGMTTATAFAAPEGSLEFWTDRLAHLGHDPSAPLERFGERFLRVHDPDGLVIEIVERQPGPAARAWDRGDVPEEHRLHGIHGVSLASFDLDATCRILEGAFGYSEGDAEGERLRLTPAGDAGTSVVDLVDPTVHGRAGAGTIHHVAFRATDEDHQAALAEAVRQQGVRVTEVRDRQYFRSVYFREPGGVLFEIATDGPGFAVDEEADSLGRALRLPPWLEERRAELVRNLPEIAIPKPS